MGGGGGGIYMPLVTTLSQLSTTLTESGTLFITAGHDPVELTQNTFTRLEVEHTAQTPLLQDYVR